MRAFFAGILTGNPASLGIVAVLILAAGFGGGWTVNGWRLGTKVADLNTKVTALESENAVFEAANKRCGVNVAEVREAVTGIVKLADARDAAARAAMDKAAGAALGHLDTAREILNRPPVPPEKQCDTVRAEQKDYVRKRKRANQGQ